MSRTLVIAACVWVFAFPVKARAWSWPAEGEPTLSFASAWTDTRGRVCEHGGVDVAAEPGEAILASSAGRVVFAGRIPASSGGSVRAVTVQTDDGLRVTCMPLLSTAVTVGACVTEGEKVGDLASGGDGSSPEPHVHLSVRKGDLSIDPMTLLPSRHGADPAPVTETASEPEPHTPDAVEPAAPVAEPSPIQQSSAPVVETAESAVAPAPTAAPVDAITAEVVRPVSSSGTQPAMLMRPAGLPFSGARLASPDAPLQALSVPGPSASQVGSTAAAGAAKSAEEGASNSRRHIQPAPRSSRGIGAGLDLALARRQQLESLVLRSGLAALAALAVVPVVLRAKGKRPSLPGALSPMKVQAGRGGHSIAH